MKRALGALIVGSTVISSLAFAGTALAKGPSEFGRSGQNVPRPVVVGTVATISGMTLTVTAQNDDRDDHATSTATTYTVDATNATVTKNGATSTVSAILIGDKVMVRGTVTGTQVVAAVINDGKMLGRPDMHGKNPKDSKLAPTAMMQGNGSPVIGGSVTAIGSTTLTVTAKSGTVYTVNTASTTVVKAGVASTLSAVAAGDNVIVQGTVNGTSVTASSIIDQGAAPALGASTTQNHGEKKGFFKTLGGFFSHMFGFF